MYQEAQLSLTNYVLLHCQRQAVSLSTPRHFMGQLTKPENYVIY